MNYISAAPTAASATAASAPPTGPTGPAGPVSLVDNESKLRQESEPPEQKGEKNDQMPLDDMKRETPLHTQSSSEASDDEDSLSSSLGKRKQNGKLRRGPWSPEEDNKLLELVRLFGGEKNLNWVKISQVLQTRTAKQARERFHQNLKPSLNRTPITPEEGRYIEELVEKYGKRWAEIARHLNGRSDNAIKNWWNGGANRRKRASTQGLNLTMAGAATGPGGPGGPVGPAGAAGVTGATPIGTSSGDEENSSIRRTEIKSEKMLSPPLPPHGPDHYGNHLPHLSQLSSITGSGTAMHHSMSSDQTVLPPLYQKPPNNVQFNVGIFGPQNAPQQQQPQQQQQQQHSLPHPQDHQPYYQMHYNHQAPQLAQSPAFQAIRGGRSASVDMRASPNYEYLSSLRKRKLMEEYPTSEPIRRHSAASIGFGENGNGFAGGHVAGQHMATAPPTAGNTTYNYNSKSGAFQATAYGATISGNSSPYPASPMSKLSSRNSSIVSADCTPLTHLSDVNSINSRRSSMYTSLDPSGATGVQFKSPSLAPKLSISGTASPQFFNNNNSTHQLGHAGSSNLSATVNIPSLAQTSGTSATKRDLFNKEFSFGKPLDQIAPAVKEEENEKKKDKEKMSISFLV